MLDVSSLNAGYGSFQALFDIDIKVNAGEAVAVIGPNGSGKSLAIAIYISLKKPSSSLILAPTREIAF